MSLKKSKTTTTMIRVDSKMMSMMEICNNIAVIGLIVMSANNLDSRQLKKVLKMMIIAKRRKKRKKMMKTH